MSKELSIKRQIKAGTLDRNEQIKALYRLGLGGLLGKQFPNRKTGKPLSRQRIHQILGLPSPKIPSQTTQKRFLAVFPERLMVFIKRLFRKEL